MQEKTEDYSEWSIVELITEMKRLADEIKAAHNRPLPGAFKVSEKGCSL